jgi:hypothetical protein
LVQRAVSSPVFLPGISVSQWLWYGGQGGGGCGISAAEGGEGAKGEGGGCCAFHGDSAVVYIMNTRFLFLFFHIPDKKRKKKSPPAMFWRAEMKNIRKNQLSGSGLSSMRVWVTRRPSVPVTVKR